MNLLNYFEQKGELVSGLLISTPLIPKMEIYGFISCLSYNKLSFRKEDPLKGFSYLKESILLADRIAFKHFNKGDKGENLYTLHPVFKRIKANVTSDKILLENLYMFNLELDDSNYKNDNYKNPYLLYTRLKNRELKPDKYPDFKKRYGIQTVIEDNKLYYLTQPGDILMYKKSYYPETNISGIGTDFLIIARYINSVTGELTHNVFLPEDVSIFSE